jgi:hypothetical protein
MSTIDITLPAYLAAPLTPPLCAEFALDGPPVELPTITLPMGAALTGIADFTRGIPSTCAMNFSLVAMIAPIMASLECPLKVIKLIGDLINAAKSGNPIQLLGVLTDAEQALSACLSLVTPIGICPFVKTVLLLIVSMLNCFLQELASVVALMEGLSAKLAAALQNGNTDEIAALNCAMENAQNTAAGTVSSIQPLSALLEIAGSFFALANINIDPLPSIPGGAGIDALNEVIATLTPVVSTIQTVLRSLPC